MIKAIFFDFYGVLAAEGTGSYAKTYFPNDDQKKASVQTMQDQLNLGKMTYEDYALGLSKLGGTDLETAKGYIEGHKPNKPLLGYIRLRLKPKYKVGIISNAGDYSVGEILSPDDLSLFDKVLLSYRVGYIKPQPEIYKAAAEQLGVEPNQCVFIDDIVRYCDGAEAVGMKSVWYRDLEQMKAELEKILAADSDN